jgi:hypothetical protein
MPARLRAASVSVCVPLRSFSGRRAKTTAKILAAVEDIVIERRAVEFEDAPKPGQGAKGHRAEGRRRARRGAHWDREG